MLSDDVEIVDRAIDHLCRGQDTVDAWLRIKAALAESTNSSHNSRVMPCLMYAGVLEGCDVFGDGKCGCTPCQLAQA